MLFRKEALCPCEGCRRARRARPAGALANPVDGTVLPRGRFTRRGRAFCQGRSLCPQRPDHAVARARSGPPWSDPRRKFSCRRCEDDHVRRCDGAGAAVRPTVRGWRVRKQCEGAIAPNHSPYLRTFALSDASCRTAPSHARTLLIVHADRLSRAIVIATALGRWFPDRPGHGSGC